MATRRRAARAEEKPAHPPIEKTQSVTVDRLRISDGLARLVRLGLGAWALIGIMILGYLVWRYLLDPVGIIFPPLILALVLVYLLNPVVTMIERRGVGRGWAAFITYLVILGIFGITLRFLFPVIANQVGEFAQAVPALLIKLERWANDLNQRFDLNIDVRDLVQSLGPSGQAGEFISRVFRFTAGVLHVVLVFVLGLLVSFYLVVDLPKVRRAASAAVPPRHADTVKTVVSDMSRAVGGYFRGQLLVATFVGLASTAGLYLVGLPYWALVGALAGLFNLIPLIGPFLAGIIALFIAFTTPDSGGLLQMDPGWPLALGSGGALLIVQQIDNHIITPNVIGRTVSLHPVTVMMALLAAGSLFGLPGMLLAVPVIGSAKVVMLHWWDRRRWPPGPGDAATGPDGERSVLKEASDKDTLGEVPA
jgi:predicted PurR-regulated permease PerM